MQIDYVAVGALRAHCYTVEGIYQGKDFVLIIDPGADFEKIISKINKPVTHIALTHAHFDHVGAMFSLHKAYPDAKICIGEHEDTSEEYIRLVMKTALGDFYFSKINMPENAFKVPKADIILRDGDDFLGFKVIHTPGHTAGSVCLYNETEKVLFSGDTLFESSYGRTDLPGGNEYDMAQSISRLMQLDPATAVYPGHNQNTTIAREKLNFGYR